jgi:hypothetical protein
MAGDITRRITAFDAAAGERLAEDLFGQASDAFDRLLPPEQMERLFQDQALPAFREYADLRRRSRHCTVGLVTHLRLPFELLAGVGCASPVGIAIRLSRKVGIVGVLDADDPYGAVVYAENMRRAYFVSKMWGPDVRWAQLGARDLGRAALLERVHAHAVTLERWERRHPPVPGFGPFPEFRVAA